MERSRRQEETDIREDLTGQTFGFLTVIGFHGYKKYPSGQRHVLWDCKCECGNDCVVLGMCLKNGGTRSCGCYKHGGRRDNEYQFTDKGYVIGKPTNSDNLFYVDNEDFETIKNHIWSERRGYMMTYINCMRVRMHRLIIGGRKHSRRYGYRPYQSQHERQPTLQSSSGDETTKFVKLENAV